MTPKKVVSSLKNLKPLPASCRRILTLLEQGKLDEDALIECLKSDKSLSSKVLKACNSSHYGFKGGLTSVDRAVAVLGSSLIVPIVLTSCLRAVLVVPITQYAFEAKELWRHSLAAAVVAETFANECLIPGIDPSIAFAVGLMHDIGKVALAQVLEPEILAAIRLEISLNKLSRIQAERAILGTDHAEVGAYLLKHLDIPDQIIDAVAYHHNPPSTSKPGLAALACISNSIAHLAGSAPGWDSYAVNMDADVLTALGLTSEKVEGLIINARDSFGRIERFVDTS